MNTSLQLRPIAPQDDARVAAIIRQVMTEFGAVGPEYSISDPEVDHMSQAYSGPNSAYFVVEDQGEILGCAGVAPLTGADPGICELRKMYLVEASRGRGIGRALLERCLHSARELGFHTCYLETLNHMNAARGLYEKFGFQKLDGPLGQTGHPGCNNFYSLSL
ncbi:MAG: GNAT family N-acetyltransferase [Planctomycetota bacterium]|nr:MAG: GNAT family N-acetyltransferase [Planctomycetota bacterium]